MKGIFYGQITEGKLVLDNRTFFDLWLKSLTEGFRLAITIEPAALNVSDQQRKFYFVAIVEPLAQKYGCEKQEMHDILKNMFLGCGVDKGREEPSITKLSIQDMSSYIDSCIRFVAECGIVAPSPDPEWRKS